jgi:branched-chain amino acid transport system ATP-binding protein
MTAEIAVPALSVRDLRAGYGSGGDIVGGVDLDQAPETVLAVIGPNGSGKSTFVKTLAGLLKARAGTIAVTGKTITRLSPAKRVAAGLAYVPQEANVFRNMTIRDNLKLATEFLRGRPGVGPAQEAQVLNMFPEIVRRPQALAGNLSGGQRQMLAVPARCSPIPKCCCSTNQRRDCRRNSLARPWRRSPASAKPALPCCWSNRTLPRHCGLPTR